MAQLQENHNESDIIVAAAPPWHPRIVRHLAIPAEAIQWCEDVYLTAARIAKRQRQAKVYILVDHLARQELEIFPALAKISGITTTGISWGNRAKLSQALQMGADEAMVLGEENPRFEEDKTAIAFEEQTKTQKDSIMEELLPREEAEAIEGEKPQDIEPIDLTGAQGGNTEPLLSQEELDALLG